MKKEKIILSIAALVLGIIFATAAFFIYQTTRQIDPSSIKKITINNKDAVDESKMFVTVEGPLDEQVLDDKNIKIVGKTFPNSSIVTLTEDREEAGVAAGNGKFTLDFTLSTGETIINVIAVSKEGEMAKDTIVITYSTEEF